MATFVKGLIHVLGSTEQDVWDDPEWHSILTFQLFICETFHLIFFGWQLTIESKTVIRVDYYRTINSPGNEGGLIVAIKKS